MKNIKSILAIFAKHNPNPKIELDYTNNFTLLVAVVLSAQSTDKIVNKATKELFRLCDTPKKILELGEEGLKEHIKIIGLYNNKAKNIIALSKILVEKYNAIVPGKFDDLMTLPGVGRKSANVVLSCAFGVPAIAVDTHVFRVANRLGISCGKTPEKVEMDLSSIIPKKLQIKAHLWLVLHGRYVCTAIKPKCDECKINDFCAYYKNACGLLSE